jgi:hypothetical protein
MRELTSPMSGRSLVIPLPTLAWSYNFGDRKQYIDAACSAVRRASRAIADTW